MTAALPGSASLGALLPDLRLISGDSDSRRDASLRMLAARMTWQITGDDGEALATAIKLMDRDWRDAAYGCELAGLVGDPAAEPSLRGLLRREETGPEAAHALVRIGAPIADFLPQYVAAIEESTFRSDWRRAVERCVETGAPELIPPLLELAVRDERVITGGDESVIVWEDDALQRALRAAVAALTVDA